MKSRKILIISALLASLQAAHAGPAPWEGSYAVDPASCGQESDSNVTYLATSLQGWEHSCDFTTVTPLTERSWLMDMSCNGEGESWNAKSVVMIDREGNLHHFSDEAMSTLRRCP